MLNGNVECYKFIDEPSQVENAVALSHGDEVVILGIFFSKLCHKAVVAADGLFHVVEADVARHNRLAFNVEIDIEIVLSAAHTGRHANIATLDFRLFKALEPCVAEVEFKGGQPLFQLLLIYLQYI